MSPRTFGLKMEFKTPTLKATKQKGQQEQKGQKAPRRKLLRFPRLPKILPKVRPLRKTQLKITESDLINSESAIGGTIFGPIPTGHRREFFLYKANTWIFHEAWKGSDGKDKETTITYQVKKSGVFKSPLGMEYVQIKGDELENFLAAAREYLKLLKAKLY